MAEHAPTLMGLESQDRLTVTTAVNKGRRVEDPRLRPMAMDLATGLIRHSGWRGITRPAVVILLCLAAVGCTYAFSWVGGAGWAALVVLCVSLAERRRRRRIDDWRRAAMLNAEEATEGE
jgi:hypothetical protein